MVITPWGRFFPARQCCHWSGRAQYSRRSGDHWFNPNPCKAQGQVQLAQSGLLTQSDEIDYNLKTQTGDLNNSFYISEQQHAHGSKSNPASEWKPDCLERCKLYRLPTWTKPAWKIQAKQIELNQDTGRGVTRGTKLYVKDVPVLAIPYFNFPIDDRRTTGILTPTFGYTNDGGAQLGVPVYLNLAPNYDLTLTPSFMSRRGGKLDGAFRYMTENFGSGRIWGGYLPTTINMTIKTVMTCISSITGKWIINGRPI